MSTETVTDTREAVLAALKADPAGLRWYTASHLAESLPVSASTARTHLNALVADGLVVTGPAGHNGTCYSPVVDAPARPETVRLVNGVEMTREAYDLLGYPPPAVDGMRTPALVREFAALKVRAYGDPAPAAAAAIHARLGEVVTELRSRGILD